MANSRPPGEAPGRRPALALVPLALGLALLLSGCSDLAYYWQAGTGQMELLRKRRPIGEVLADPGVAGPVKHKLELVQEAQDYGVTSLGLPRGARFRYYADLGRPYVSWMVVTAEPYALKAVPQCYLIVGCLGYRGFFDKADANRFAAEMGGDGYDTLVRPVTAYSTLGWFDDPLLSSYIRAPDAQLLSTVFHEQAHQVVFVDGDTDFNESFATFVAEEGVRRFFGRRGPEGAAEIQRFLARGVERERFQQILVRGRERLEALYAHLPPPPERPQAKARAFAQMREDYRKAADSFKILSYDGWFSQALNNAHLVGVAHYRSRVEAFRALLAENGGELKPFFEAVRKLAGLPPAQRAIRLNQLQNAHLAKS